MDGEFHRYTGGQVCALVLTLGSRHRIKMSRRPPEDRAPRWAQPGRQRRHENRRTAPAPKGRRQSYQLGERNVGARGLERPLQDAGELRRGRTGLGWALPYSEVAGQTESLSQAEIAMWDLDDWKDFAEVIKNFAQTAFIAAAIVALLRWAAKDTK